MAPPTLSLTLLGSARGLLASGTPLTIEKRKAWALLGYLALHPAELHRRERLATLLWSNAPDAQARQSLRQAIRSLRSALGAMHARVLIASPASLGLVSRRLEVDVWTFERLAVLGTRPALRRATQLYGGELLDGLSVDTEEYDAWLVAQRERLRRLAVTALSRLLGLELDAGADDLALATAGRLLELDPCDEPAHRAVMRLLAKQGRRAAAQRQYEFCVEALRRDLNVSPSPETAALHRQLVDGTRSAVARQTAGEPTRPVVQARNPVGAPFVGREVELARLRQHARQSSAGRAQIVAVMGEAGVGKTRLLSELAREFQRNGGRILVGRAHESEQILPFAPWIQAVEGVDIVAETGLVAALPRPVREALGRLLPALAGDALPATPDHHRRLFEALAYLMHRIATDRPVLVLLEDLHWADEMSLRVLAFLARRLGKARVLLVVTAREEEIPGGILLRRIFEELQREDTFSRVTLTALSRDETDTLVRHLAARGATADPASMVDIVWRASEGNPFVAIETVHAIEHALPEASGLALPVPPRVQELITTRLERLPAPARELLLIAAVVGRPCDFALLRDASGSEEQSAAEAVQLLVQQRLLRATGDQLEICHERVRGTVLATLLPARRAVLHATVARSLARVYAGRLAPHHAALAVHAREGGLWELAAEHFRQAAFQAAERSAMREAARDFREALAALERVPDSQDRWRAGVDLRLDLRSALQGLGELGEIATILDEAGVLAGRVGDVRRLAWVDAYRAQHRFMVGRPAEGLPLARRAREIAISTNDAVLELVAEYSCAITCCGTGAYEISAKSFERVLSSQVMALESAPIGFHGSPFAASEAMLTLVLGQMGAFERGLVHGRQALARAEAQGTPLSIALATLGLAFLHVTRGAVEEALDLLQRGLQVAQDWEVHIFASQLRRELGWCLALAGRITESLEVSEAACHGATAINLYQPSFLNRLGEVYLRAGRRHEALGLAGRSLALARERGQRGFEAWALRLLGEIHAEGPTHAAAAANQHYRDALAVADECHMRPLAAHCHAGLGRLARRAGRADGVQQLTTAATLYEQMGMIRWLRPVRDELLAAPP